MVSAQHRMMIDAQTANRRRAIRAWLYVCAVLISVTVLVGGATRLTGSGLSIVEWQPVTGVFPPFSEAAWTSAFEKYQAIPQFRELNSGMTLSEFKFIYWWEWTHRMLGRVIGGVFLLPFLWFLWRGWIEPAFRARLWVIFGLGALQGAVGWWMVKSGLATRVSVAHERLAFHLALACVIYAAIVWTIQRLRTADPIVVPSRIRAGAMTLLVLMLVQIFVGALVAGLHAGLVHNTWPLIDGAWVPTSDRLFFMSPVWSNFFDNVLTVQFEHRMIAYALWLLAITHLTDVIVRRERAALNGALALVVALTIQAGLGIVTLLHQAPLSLSLLHQGMAVIVLTISVIHAGRLTARPAEVGLAKLQSVPRT